MEEHPRVFYFGTRFVNRIGCRDPTPSWRPTAVRTNASDSVRAAPAAALVTRVRSDTRGRVLFWHVFRPPRRLPQSDSVMAPGGRPHEGVCLNTTTPALPRREPFGARHPPSLANLQNSNSDHVPQYHHDMPSCTATTATSNARHPPPPAAQPTGNPEPLAPAALRPASPHTSITSNTTTNTSTSRIQAAPTPPICFALLKATKSSSHKSPSTYDRAGAAIPTPAPPPPPPKTPPSPSPPTPSPPTPVNVRDERAPFPIQRVAAAACSVLILFYQLQFHD